MDLLPFLLLRLLLTEVLLLPFYADFSFFFRNCVWLVYTYVPPCDFISSLLSETIYAFMCMCVWYLGRCSMIYAKHEAPHIGIKWFQHKIHTYIIWIIIHSSYYRKYPAIRQCYLPDCQKKCLFVIRGYPFFCDYAIIYKHFLWFIFMFYWYGLW